MTQGCCMKLDSLSREKLHKISSSNADAIQLEELDDEDLDKIFIHIFSWDGRDTHEISERAFKFEDVDDAICYAKTARDDFGYYVTIYIPEEC